MNLHTNWYIRHLSLIALIFILPACLITHTFLDGFFYPATDYYEQVTSDTDAIKICNQLETRGYLFDQFTLNVSGIEVSYPGGRQERFPYTMSVSPVVLIDISRDYNNPDIFSDEEFARLQENAQLFCSDYYQAANELGVRLSLSGILYWDYVNGVRGGFWLSETCEITGGYGWGTGSYASSYELDPSAICPSGRVRY